MIKNNKSFKALVIRKDENRNFNFKIENRKIEDLPDNEVLIKVFYSSINFKDGMSCLGNPSITRKFPHTPGVDAAGLVEYSKSEKFIEGDKVFIIGYPLGMSVPGGFGEYVSVKHDWIQKLEFDLTFEEIMALGTAGFTAALSVEKLCKKYDNFKKKKVIISGISGGCGSITACIMKKLGSDVSGISRKANSLINLKELIGIDEIIDTESFLEKNKQNLALENWDIGFDYVGGELLTQMLKTIKVNGDVTTAGMAYSSHIKTSTLPFILRGITLHGINTEHSIKDFNKIIWEKLSKEWKIDNFTSLYKIINLHQLPEYLKLFLNNKIIGRIVIKHDF